MCEEANTHHRHTTKQTVKPSLPPPPTHAHKSNETDMQSTYEAHAERAGEMHTHGWWCAHARQTHAWCGAPAVHLHEHDLGLCIGLAAFLAQPAHMHRERQVRAAARVLLVVEVDERLACVCVGYVDKLRSASGSPTCVWGVLVTGVDGLPTCVASDKPGPPPDCPPLKKTFGMLLVSAAALKAGNDAPSRYPAAHAATTPRSGMPASASASSAALMPAHRVPPSACSTCTRDGRGGCASGWHVCGGGCACVHMRVVRSKSVTWVASGTVGSERYGG
eukprot:351897-Chlamydomonas_euryale.AAC.8